ncbi:MAG: family 20 glycosylhydrolase [Flavobacteriales bacterium]|nr:family 20 glycosylhydrolase [Flavobacteriales bacterium]HQV52064.1 family 20 glycosylhydrolase [Flavobacteriales bacterium]HQX38289.1 family 20 glycosylhydrolase [Flavobacteriales bacterium]HQZ92272.1 family 20 glycosylhydrolase [Flavobacteriales bacterium]
MRPILLFFLLPLLTHAQLAVPGIIPAPAELTLTKGDCRLDRPWKLIGTSIEAKALTEFLSTEISNIRSASDVVSGTPLPIILEQVVFDTLVPDGYYSLGVDLDRITITSNSEQGLFYGTRTLIQLLEYAKEHHSIPCLVIVDHPRFSWRGMHLDVVRHFFPVGFVKKYINLLARYKMNSFHWHLTDDQGWRIEIKQHPKLTAVGGQRKGSQVGPYGRLEYDSIPYGGFYTQEQIREVVAYAAARHINVVPEIEMPGHAMAALAAYPELGCTGGPYEVQRGWGVFEDVFCAGNDTVFTMLEDILSEVMDLFPGPYIHIGGDESPKDRWKVCPKCQARMNTNGLKDEHELQSYFIQRIENYVNSKGRNIIGWDEILEGGLAPNAAVMSWRGTEGGVAAAKSGHDAVMSPGSHCYFDHYQGDPANEPLAFGGYTTVQKVYSYEPVPEELNAEQANHILGAQGNIWTEYILTPEHVEYMLAPRMLALAEVLWTPKEKRDEAGFIERLEAEFPRLDAMNVNYSKSLYQVSFKLSQGTAPGSILVRTPYYGGSGVKVWQEPEVILELDGSGLTVRSDAVLKAHGYINGGATPADTSSITLRFNKATAQKITLSAQPNERYGEGGAFTLVDGITAQEKRVNTEWLGWKENVTITVDLGNEQDINSIGIGALNETHSWIHLPEQVDIATSLDGKDYSPYGTVKAETSNSGRMELGKELTAKARYVRLSVKHKATIPDGFQGAGNPSWLFLDEVTVR